MQLTCIACLSLTLQSCSFATGLKYIGVGIVIVVIIWGVLIYLERLKTKQMQTFEESLGISADMKQSTSSPIEAESGDIKVYGNNKLKIYNFVNDHKVVVVAFGTKDIKKAEYQDFDWTDNLTIATPTTSTYYFADKRHNKLLCCSVSLTGKLESDMTNLPGQDTTDEWEFSSSYEVVIGYNKQTGDTIFIKNCNIKYTSKLPMNSHSDRVEMFVLYSSGYIINFTTGKGLALRDKSVDAFDIPSAEKTDNLTLDTSRGYLRITNKSTGNITYTTGHQNLTKTIKIPINSQDDEILTFPYFDDECIVNNNTLKMVIIDKANNVIGTEDMPSALSETYFLNPHSPKMYKEVPTFWSNEYEIFFFDDAKRAVFISYDDKKKMEFDYKGICHGFSADDVIYIDKKYKYLKTEYSDDHVAWLFSTADKVIKQTDYYDVTETKHKEGINHIRLNLLAYNEDFKATTIASYKLTGKTIDNDTENGQNKISKLYDDALNGLKPLFDHVSLAHQTK